MCHPDAVQYSTVTTRSRPASPPHQAGGTSTKRHGEVQPTGLSAVSAVGSPRPERNGRGSAALGVAPGQGCHPSGGVRHTRPHTSLLVGPVGREAGVPPGQWPRDVGFAPIPPRGGLGPTAIVHGTVLSLTQFWIKNTALEDSVVGSHRRKHLKTDLRRR